MMLLGVVSGGGGGGGAVLGLMTTVEAVDFIEVIEDCDMVEDKVELGELEEFLTLPLVKLWLFLRRSVPALETFDKDFFKVFRFSFILAKRLEVDLDDSEWFGECPRNALSMLRKFNQKSFYY